MVHRRKIEAAVLDGLREVLKDPGYFAIYLKAYNDERTRLARGAVNHHRQGPQEVLTALSRMSALT